MQKPTSVMVFGILNIVFAALGFVGMLFSLVLFLPQVSANNPVVQLIHDSPAYAAWLKFCMVLGFVVCVMLLAAGIGLLQFKPWARTASIIYGYYSIVQIVVGTVVNYFLMVRPMLEQAQHKNGAEAAGAIGGAIGGTIGGCVGLVYPILLLIFMKRANVVAAFASQSADGNNQAG